MRTIITTVGTSLLTNRDEEAGGAARPWSGWRRGRELPSLDTAVAFLSRANSVEATAETHTLLRLPLRETDRLAWLHSDTPEGRWCATALHDHYKSQGYQGQLDRIGGLGYRAAVFADYGLRSLLSAAFKVVKDAGGADHTVICATGGFKAELAYLSVAGLLLGINVYYLNEQFDDLVSLPRLPIDWNMAWVERNEAFFRWIDEEPRPSAEVENWLKATPDLRSLVADDADSTSYLTAAGDLLYQAYRERSARQPGIEWPEASPRAPHEKNQVSKEQHHRPRGWERVVARLTQLTWVESVRFDAGGKGGSGEHPRIYATDPASGAIGIVFGAGATALPLRVETTARGEVQLDLVRDWIERNMKKWT